MADDVTVRFGAGLNQALTPFSSAPTITTTTTASPVTIAGQSQGDSPGRALIVIGIVLMIAAGLVLIGVAKEWLPGLRTTLRPEGATGSVGLRAGGDRNRYEDNVMVGFDTAIEDKSKNSTFRRNRGYRRTKSGERDTPPS